MTNITVRETRAQLANVHCNSETDAAVSSHLLERDLIQATSSNPKRDYHLTGKGFDVLSGFHALTGINRHFEVNPCIWSMGEDSCEWATRYIVRAYELSVIDDFDLWVMSNEALLESVMTQVFQHLGFKIWSGYPLQKIEASNDPNDPLERWAAETLAHWTAECSGLRYEGLDIDPLAAAEKTVAQRRAALEHILADGLEIGVFWSERIPVAFQHDERHGWVFVSRADANRGNLYPAADATYREAERMKKTIGGKPS
jgi:hypothetical protein